MRRALSLIIVLALAVAGATLAYLLFADRPTLPSALSGTPFTSTNLQSPDPAESLDPSTSSWLIGSNCPVRQATGQSIADFCWFAKGVRDERPSADRVNLEVEGTFGGNGTRWIVIEVRPTDSRGMALVEGVPLVKDSGCFGLPNTDKKLCGRVLSGLGTYADSWRVSWACEPCLPWDTADRSIAVELTYDIPEGSIPNWDLFVELGR